MNGTNENSPDETSTAHSRLSSLTPEQLVHINLCCDQYERLWRDQGTAFLADFLQRTTANRIDALHEALVQELVLIDIELRQRNGLQQTAEYYLEASATLNRVWLDEQLAHSMAQGSQTEANELANGQRIGDYVILEPLGAGGMGSVYRAEHVLMKRPVALKIIQRQYQSNPLLQRRFEREVRTLAKLSHPNVVTAFDARQDSGWLYLVTELIEGRDLGKLVREKGPLSPVKAAHYAWQAANGLHYAHSKGIVHRDIKPENLFLDQGQKIKVLDLGLARLSASDFEHADRAGLTESSQVLGTAAYISPEQARAAATADHRSDIYSLGCTLFFLLTGRPPYVGDSLVATIVAHVSEPVPSVVQPSNRQPIPPQLDALVQSMMAKNPSDRPKSMSVVVAELAAIIKQLQTTAQTSTAQTSTAQTSTAQASTVQASASIEMPTQPLKSHPVTHYSKVNTTPWRLRSAIGRRKFLWGSLIAAPVITFATYRAFQFLFRGFNGTQAPEKSLSTLSGLRFNGKDNYVEVSNFDEQIVGHVAIEAIVRANFSKSPVNIVSWTGNQCFVLFRSAGNEWGAAYFNGVTAQLVVASHSTRPGTVQMVAAMWNGTKLSLHVDGELVESYPIEYEMISAPDRLFIGGIPDGIIPSQQGTRYVDGEIAVVRVSRSAKPLTLAADPLGLVVRPETLAMFDFRKPTYRNTTDLTNRWQARLRGTY